MSRNAYGPMWIMKCYLDCSQVEQSIIWWSNLGSHVSDQIQSKVKTVKFTSELLIALIVWMQWRQTKFKQSRPKDPSLSFKSNIFYISYKALNLFQFPTIIQQYHNISNKTLQILGGLDVQLLLHLCSKWDPSQDPPKLQNKLFTT